MMWIKAIHSPEVVIHSPAEMAAAWPTTVTISRSAHIFGPVIQAFPADRADNALGVGVLPW